jgi:signal peptidase I
MNESSDEKNAPLTIEKKESGGFLKVFIITFACALFIRAFVAQPFVVNGASMEQTFKTDEYLVIDELSLHLRDPIRGEVVVFKSPENPSRFFIKRVIGLPGETVTIKNGTVTISKKDTKSFTLKEPYINTETHGSVVRILRDKEYFVMGDNRDVSSDSRFWGPVPRSFIIGRVLFRFLPLSKMEITPGVATYQP